MYGAPGADQSRRPAKPSLRPGVWFLISSIVSWKKSMAKLPVCDASTLLGIGSTCRLAAREAELHGTMPARMRSINLIVMFLLLGPVSALLGSNAASYSSLIPWK